MAKQILIVEAENDSLFLAVDKLKQSGYIVSKPESKDKALTFILDAKEKGSPLDLVCVEVKKTDMVGMDLIYELAKKQVSVPIIVVSDFVDRTLIAELVGCCCSDLLVKPFLPHELEKRVRDIFCKRR